MSSNILNAWLVEDVSCLVHIDYPSSCPRFMCMHVNCTLFTFWIWYICPLFLQAESLTMCCCLLCFDLDLTHVRTWKTSEVNFKKQVLTICKLNTLDIILLVFFLNSCKAYAKLMSSDASQAALLCELQVLELWTWDVSSSSFQIFRCANQF